ncbi:MAG: molybdate ABC transporter permease subunit, partial [Rhodanobacteraceae bacterium]
MDILTHAETVALALSFKVSLVGVVCSLPVAVGCAWLLARTRFFGKPLFEGLLLLPLILPPVVTGYVLLIAFGHHGAIGRLL